MIGEVHLPQQVQTYPATAPYHPCPVPDPSSAPPTPQGYFTGENQREDIADLQEVTKELARSNCVQVDQSEFFLNKPIYSCGNSFENFDCRKKGFVSIDDITIADKLSHSEFIEIVKSFLQSQQLLFPRQELTKSQEKRKRILLGLLSNLNWRVRDVFLQARLLKSVDERVQMLQSYLVDESKE